MSGTLGTFDPTFGTAGRTPLGFYTYDVAVDSLSRTVVVGAMGADAAVMRLTAAGAPDPNFGSNGLVTIDFGGKRFDRAQRVTIQSDGKILVGGIMANSGGGDRDSSGKFALARLNANGTLDGTFGNGGTETVFGNQTLTGISGLGIAPGGKIVFSGSVQRGGDFDFLAARLLSNGTVDTSFGSNGAAVTGMGGEDTAVGQVIEPDGKIVVGGTRLNIDDDVAQQYALARFTAAGKLDNSFDRDGKVITTMVGESILYSITEQSDGKILAAGQMRGPDGITRVMLRRFNTDGSQDLSLVHGTLQTRPSADSVASVATNVFFRGNEIVVVGMNETPRPGGGVAISGAFASQYFYNGSLDTSFGNNGIARFDIAGGALWPRAALAPDGKIVFAYWNGNSPNGGVARFTQVIPQVYIVDHGFTATEGANDGVFRIGDSGPYDFPIRVYINLRGDATYGVDYTSTMNIPLPVISTNMTTARTRGARTRGVISSRINTNIFGTPDYAYIDIPAGKAQIDVPIHVIDDNLLEPSERADFILRDDPHYIRDQQSHTAFVQIFDNDDAHINFQAAGQVLPPAPYKVDLGQAFGDRGSGLKYGWDTDNSANARTRGNAASPDFRFDTFNHMQKSGADRKWEIAVPNGMYQVTLTAGDPNATDSVYRINLEGQLALSGTPSGDVHWFTRTTNVIVTDGKLTVSNGAGAVNNKLAFIDIKNPSYGSQPGTVTPDTGIHLKALPAKPLTRNVLAEVKRSLFSAVLMDAGMN
jgi:uncharacterized delta-60 repeat protein